MAIPGPCNIRVHAPLSYTYAYWSNTTFCFVLCASVHGLFDCFKLEQELQFSLAI